ncbi:sigma-70 RNA polymerase sigma factor region 4 domain-containing protein [Allosalinactinospora lopnorensis]|uniref:sigma-70 family RNA polymerase sigma factor n=1 Tax=Allosalinactinospora lopnorensis TaxID=1352348 RepID=UPI000623F804|nr:sigma-70 family RNA polymerase sigma factor [Allosalinactinospora lopnorensis]
MLGDLLERLEADYASEEGDQLRQGQENLLRRLADHTLLSELAEDGFTGPRYEMFEADLAAYGYPVMLSWIRKRRIYSLCARQGRPLQPLEADAELLSTSFNERLGLAVETVAEALKFFRDHALMQRKWSIEGGASIKTYFVGACLLAFPNVYRRWSGERAKWRQAHSVAAAFEDDRCVMDHIRDPAETATLKLMAQQAMDEMPPDTREIAELVLDGHTHAEIGQQLG